MAGNEADEAKGEQVMKVMMDHSKECMRNVGGNWRVRSSEVAWPNT